MHMLQLPFSMLRRHPCWPRGTNRDRRTTRWRVDRRV